MGLFYVTTQRHNPKMCLCWALTENWAEEIRTAGACDQMDDETNPPFSLQFETSRGASGLSSISALCVSPACKHLLKPWHLSQLSPPTGPQPGNPRVSKSPRMLPRFLVPCQAISSIYFLWCFHGHICQPRQVPPASEDHSSSTLQPLHPVPSASTQ